MVEWVSTTLGEVVAKGHGKIQTGPFGSQLHAADYVDAGIPCIMPTNMKSNRVDLTEIAFITEEDARRLSQHLVREGDIVYSRRGDVTQKALIRKDEAGFFCGTGCLLVRPGSAIDPEFLTYHLSTPSNQAWIVNQAVGAHMANLNTGILAEVPLRVPPKSEQQKIASVLSALDAKIDLNHRINAELEALAKNIYDYWFVQFDFPDAKGRPYKTSGGKMVWNEVLKREIPAGWENVSLRDLVDCNANSYGTNNLPDEIVYLDTGNLTENRLLGFEGYDTSKDEVPSRARRIAENGDVLYSTVRPNQNHHGVIKETIENLVVSTGFAVLTCIDTHLGGDFVYMFLRADDVAMRMQRIAESSRSSYPSISPDDLLDLGLALPKNRAQVSNACQFFDQTFKTIWVNEKQNRELTQLRDWLLPLLMNGQVRVK